MNVASIKDFDVNNGEGIRVSLWVSGCPHHCKNCHNPESWNPNFGVSFEKKHLDKIIKLLRKDINKDFSILGGEPLVDYNIENVTYICKTLKYIYPDLNIWIWTGYLYENIKDKEILKYIDVLVDGKYIEEQKDLDLLWRGSANQRVIDVKESLKQGKVIKYID